MPQNLLIIGATGFIGKPITREIVNSKGSFGRIAVLTSQSTVQKKLSEIDQLKHSGIEILVGDITSEVDVKKAYQNIDTVISCVGRSVIAQQIPLIQWTSETSVRRFFPSEYGTDIEYSPKSASEKPHQQKLKVRRYMATMKNLEWTYLVTGPYSDLYFESNRSRPEVGSFDVKEKRAWLLGDGKGIVSFTAMADVGKLVVAALQHPDASRNKALIVNSFTTTPEEILAEFENLTGTKWEVEYTSLEKLREMEKQAWQDQDPMATLLTLRRIWTEGGTLYKKRDNSLIDDPPMETVADQVRHAVQKVSGQ